MKRQIRFKVWDSTNKVMLLNDTSLRICFTGKIWDSGLSDYRKDMTLMEYTGMKDSNGKKIYEGDILKVIDEFEEESIRSVYYGENYPAFTLDPSFEAEYNDLQHACFVCQCEVIGNIYENPDLLK